MQCDVHTNPDDVVGCMPYLLDVQANLVSNFATRIVVPLVRAASFGRRADLLHPVFVVEGAEVVMATHLLAAVRRSAIGARVASLVDHRAAIIGAIDVLSSVV